MKLCITHSFPEILSNLFEKGLTIHDKNPKSLLNDIMQNAVTFTFIPHDGQCFIECVATVEGRNFHGFGSTESEAKTIVSKEILSLILDISYTDTVKAAPVERITLGGELHADKIGDFFEQLVIAKFDTLMENHAEYRSYKILSGIIMTRDDRLATAQVVALGTGSKFLYYWNLNESGDTVNDSHAEVVCRRGLLRMFYTELIGFDEKKSSNIFIRANISDGRFKLRPGVKFHLYLSSAPCGDGRVYSHANGREPVSF